MVFTVGGARIMEGIKGKNAGLFHAGWLCIQNPTGACQLGLAWKYNGVCHWFSKHLMYCVDMNNDKALFCFVDGLLLQLQVWVRTRKPQMLQDAMQIAEEVGSTLASASPSSQMKKHKQSIAVPVYVGRHQRSGDYAVPMELGTATKFTRKCYHFGRSGHKAADCRQRKAASQPVANRM